MVKVKRCAYCRNLMILDFEKTPKDGICPYCGAAFRYRLLGNSICEIDMTDPVFFGTVMKDGASK